MRKLFYLLFLVLGLGLPLMFLGGCMMWMHAGDHGESGHGQGPGKTVVKEWSDRDIVLSMDVPRLTAGKEASLVLKAGRIEGSTPVTGARAGFLIERADGGGQTGVEREAAETQKGIYKAEYRFEEHGPYRITARLVTIEQPDVQLTITATEEAGGHERKKDITFWMILGGIGMMAMMVLVML